MALENIKTFKRPENRKITDYLNKFEQLHNKIKSYGAQMPENVSAYQLFNLPSYLNYRNKWLKEQSPVLILT